MSHRILYVIDSLRPLGQAFQLHALLPQIAQEFEIHVAVLEQSENAFNPLCGANVKIHYLPTSSAPNPRPVSGLMAAAWQLKQLARRLRPSVVHPWGARGEQVLAVARSLKGDELNSAAVVCTHSSVLPKGGFLADYYLRRQRGWFDHVVMPHEALAGDMYAAGYNDAQIVVVPNAAVGGDAPHDAPQRRSQLMERLGLKESSKKPLVIAATVADLVPATRLKDLIWATDLLTCIGDNFHFVVFGTGAGRAALERFAGFTLAQSHVHFVEDANAVPLLAAVDVYWHSHLMTPLPSPMLAAMASAVPVVSVYGDSTHDVIRHQETAMAVNFGARDEFARWTKFFIEKPDAARQLAVQGSRYASATFALSLMVDGYRKIYQRLSPSV